MGRWPELDGINLYCIVLYCKIRRTIVGAKRAIGVQRRVGLVANFFVFLCPRHSKNAEGH